MNPSDCWYPAGSKARSLDDAFNRNYTSLLKALQLVFTGQPDWLGPAVQSMEGMKAQAMTMMSTELVPGMTLGPTFRYLPGQA